MSIDNFNKICKTLSLKQQYYKKYNIEKLLEKERYLFNDPDGIMDVRGKALYEFNYYREFFRMYDGPNSDLLIKSLEQMLIILGEENPDFNEFCKWLIIACEICGFKTALYEEMLNADFENLNFVERAKKGEMTNARKL